MPAFSKYAFRDGLAHVVFKAMLDFVEDNASGHEYHHYVVQKVNVVQVCVGGMEYKITVERLEDALKADLA